MKMKRLLAFVLAGTLCLSETVAYAAVNPEQESNAADTEYQSDTGTAEGDTQEDLPAPIQDTGDSTATMSNARPDRGQEENPGEGSYEIATVSNAVFMAEKKVIEITLTPVSLSHPDGSSTTVDLEPYLKKLSEEEKPAIKVGEMDAEKKYYDTPPAVNGTELSFTLKKAIQSVTLTIPLELTNEKYTYTDQDGKPLALTVKVKGIDAISLNYTTRTMGVGETFLFQTNEIIPAEEIAWSSSVPECVTVNQKGEAEALKTGTAVVTAEWEGLKVACTVTVSKSSSTPAISNGKTNNVGKQDYTNTRWAQPVKSYLMDNKDGTFTRVEYDSDQVLVETYRSDETIIDRKAIEMELPLFGGFYGGEKYNFLVFGQSNPKEDNSQEVIRVVRYTKNWERAGAARLLGANTLRPFEAGSLRMTEYGNRLYLRTSHTMYASEKDGLNHQANLTALINTETMWITDSYYDVMNTNYGYVSHSFNQFITLDGDTLIAADHGDAYPRAVVLFRYKEKAGGDGFMYGNAYEKVDHINVLPIKGRTGDNTTGASVGGLTVTGTSYLVAGNSIDQEDENSNVNGVRNIFVTSTDKEKFSAESTKIHWITEFKGSEKVSTPQMVKINDDKVLLLYTVNSRLNYVYVNGSGEKISPIYEAYGKLSDCQPVVMGDQAVWYYTEKSQPQFCRLGGKLEKITLNAGLTKTMRPGETFQFELNEVVPINEVRWSSSKEEVVSVSSNGLIETDEKGTSVVTASWNGLEVSCRITVKQPSSGGSSGGGGGSSSGGGGGGVRTSGAKKPAGSVGPANLPSYVVQGNWSQIGDVWFFNDASGLPYVNRWAAVYNPYANTAIGQSNYDWFWFDPYGRMITGWHLDADGNYYYLNEASDGTRGRMVTGWFWIKDADGVQRCYYFDPVADTGTRGKMMRNTVVDGYQIDANGHWVVNGVVQTK